MPNNFDDEPRRSRYRDSLPAKPRRNDDTYDDRPRQRAGPSGFYRPNADECQSAMLCHLLAIFMHFIGPIIIWATKKDESRFVDYHGREALNFSINMMVWALVAVLLITVIAVVTCGFGAVLFPLALGVNVYALVMHIIALSAANRGEWYSYPMIFRIIPQPQGLEGLEPPGRGDDYLPAGSDDSAEQPQERRSLLWVWLLCGTAAVLLGGCCIGGIVYAVIEERRSEAKARATEQVEAAEFGRGDDFPALRDDAPRNQPPVGIPGGPPVNPPVRPGGDRPKPADPPRDPIEQALTDIRSINRADKLRAIETLGKSGDKRAPKALAEALKELGVRRAAQDALKQFGSAAEDEVAAMLNVQDIFTKQAACDVLKEIGTKKSLAALQPLTADKNKSIAKHATDAITAINDRGK
jgi:uncharacterized Tic20 family protein